MKRFIGFSLAEILMTLIIIGIISAMTVPMLNKNADEQSYILGLNKAYATLSNATGMLEAQYGSIHTFWDWSDSDAILEKYAKVMNAKKSGSNALVTQDGMMFRLYRNNGSCNGNLKEDFNDKYCGVFKVDVNGEKGPNQATMDQFDFIVTKDSTLPSGHLAPEEACNFNGLTTLCTASILYSGKMPKEQKNKKNKI